MKSEEFEHEIQRNYIQVNSHLPYRSICTESQTLNDPNRTDDLPIYRRNTVLTLKEEWMLRICQRRKNIPVCLSRSQTTTDLRYVIAH